MEANQKKREEYLNLIKDIEYKNLVYIDESGIEKSICKDKDWGKKGEILQAKKSGRSYERTNIVSGLCDRKSVAPFVFNGSCNTELFENWVEQFLIDELKPGQFVVMDNASFHKSQRTRQLISTLR